MIELFNNIKDYIIDTFKDNSNFNINSNNVIEAYLYNHDVKAPEIAIDLENIGERDTSSSVYEGANVFNYNLQLYCYGKQQKIDGKLTSAQKVSMILSNTLENNLNKNKALEYVKNIISWNIRSVSPSIPLKEGTLYYSVIRIEFSCLA